MESTFHRLRTPRLELLFGVVTAATTVQSLGIFFHYGGAEPVWVGLAVGLGIGWVLRRQLLGEHPWATDGQRNFAAGVAWLLGGALVAALSIVWLVAANDAQFREQQIEVVMHGVLVALLTFPAVIWVLAKARSATRARRGSIVAAADRRAIWGAAAAALALESLAHLPRWDGRPCLVDLRSPEVSLLVVVAALLVALLCAASDGLALRRICQLAEESDDLDVLSDDVPAGGTDVGVGDEVLGEVRVGASYRATSDRVPLLRGSPILAEVIVARAAKTSVVRLLAIAAVLVVHLAVAAHAPPPYRPLVGHGVEIPALGLTCVAAPTVFDRERQGG